MDAQSNKELIRKILADFAAGTADSLLEEISDDVVWEVPNPDNKLPIRSSYQGRDGTLQLLEDVGTLSEVIVFEPQEFIAEGDTVVVIVHEESTAKPTGKRFEQDFVQVWTLRSGKITRCRLFEDTYAAVNAFAM